MEHWEQAWANEEDKTGVEGKQAGDECKSTGVKQCRRHHSR